MRKLRVRFLEMRVNWLARRVRRIKWVAQRRTDRINRVRDWRCNRLIRRAERLTARAEKINKRIS